MPTRHLTAQSKSKYISAKIATKKAHRWCGSFQCSHCIYQICRKKKYFSPSSLKLFKKKILYKIHSFFNFIVMVGLIAWCIDLQYNIFHYFERKKKLNKNKMKDEKKREQSKHNTRREIWKLWQEAAKAVTESKVEKKPVHFDNVTVCTFGILVKKLLSMIILKLANYI